jgi:hypothetical protein
MDKKQLPFEYDLFLSYPVIGRIQPVIALEQAICALGKIDTENYFKFRYLQLELIVKQCELLSDVAGYINAIEEFHPTQSAEDIHVNFIKIYKLLTGSQGKDIHRFFESIDSKDDQFFYRILGYDILDKIPSAAEVVKKAGDLNDSVGIVKSIFKDMAHFRSTFWGIYNAYKHGYRLFVDRGKCELVEFSGVSGDLDSFTMDLIVYADNEGKRIPLRSFNRGQAEYNHLFYYLFQGIVSAFTMKLVNAYGGFLDYDLSCVNIPLIRVLRRNGNAVECVDIQFSFKS